MATQVVPVPTDFKAPFGVVFGFDVTNVYVIWCTVLNPFNGVLLANPRTQVTSLYGRASSAYLVNSGILPPLV